jgi:hypothetical protein
MVTDVVAALLGAVMIIVFCPALHESVVTHAAAASCVSDGAVTPILEPGPNRTMKLLELTVVEAIVAPDETVTVTPPTERLDVLVESVTSLKLVAADTASGRSSAAIVTKADVRNFFMRVH